MAQLNLYAQYNDVSFATSSPAGLVVTSYQAAVRALKEVARAMRDNDFASRTRNIDLAFELISELRKSLNPEKGGEIADKLSALYEYFTREIVAANALGDPDRLTPVIEMMSELADAWEEARKKTTQQNQSTSIQG